MFDVNVKRLRVSDQPGCRSRSFRRRLQAFCEDYLFILFSVSVFVFRFVFQYRIRTRPRTLRHISPLLHFLHFLHFSTQVQIPCSQSNLQSQSIPIPIPFSFHAAVRHFIWLV